MSLPYWQASERLFKYPPAFFHIPFEFADVDSAFNKLIYFIQNYRDKNAKTHLSKFVCPLFVYFFLYLLQKNYAIAEEFYKKNKHFIDENDVELVQQLLSLKNVKDSQEHLHFKNFWHVKYSIAIPHDLLEELQNAQECKVLNDAFDYLFHYKVMPGIMDDDDYTGELAISEFLFTFKNSNILYMDLNQDESEAVFACGGIFVYLVDMYNPGRKVRVVTDGIKEPVFSVKYILHKDKSEILLGCDKLVYLFNTSKCEVIKSFTGHMSAILDMDVDSSGKLLATVSEGLAAWVISLSNGEVQQLLKGHTKVVNIVRFDPKGEYIVTGSDKTVQLFTFQGIQIICFKGHKFRIDAIAFSPTGFQLSSVDIACNIKVWDLTELKEIFCLKNSFESREEGDIEKFSENKDLKNFTKVTSLCYNASGTTLAATWRNFSQGKLQFPLNEHFKLQPFEGGVAIRSIKNSEVFWVDKFTESKYIPFLSKFDKNGVLKLFLTYKKECFSNSFCIKDRSFPKEFPDALKENPINEIWELKF